ncbi:MAG: hypothetical protein Kow00124_07390 [Anaerolineae bacterium]
MAALTVVLVAFVLLIGLTIFIRRGFRPPQRPLTAYRSLRGLVGQAVEGGRRTHLSLGPGSLIGEEANTILAGLAVLDAVAEGSTIGDLLPVTTTGDAPTWLVMGDTMLRVYRKHAMLDRYRRAPARLVALDAMAMAGGITSIIHDEAVQGSVLIGSFGPEVALITEAASRHHIPQVVGSDRLEAQAVAFAVAEHPIIGEEVYVARAYLDDPPPSALAGLAVQDVLRWLVVGVIVIGAVLASLGLLG